MIRQPYLLFLGDVTLESDAKTAFGLRDWAGQACLAQLRLPGATVDLGLPDMTPGQAAEAGAGTLVIGIAPVGGSLPQSWIPILRQALGAGLDLAAGLHDRLADIPELAEAAKRLGRTLHDVRVPARRYPVGTGRKRSGLRLLTVGTDCALGKKYTALAIANELKARGREAHFRATGQTGILISGEGVPLDAVVGDFLSGAAEALSPDTDAGVWQVIEGQGAILHPSYAAVTLGLLHGSQPDALVLCHDPSRSAIEAFPDFRIRPLDKVMEHYLRSAVLTNPAARFVGLSLNTSKLPPGDAERLLSELSERHRLPAMDPLRTGAGPIVDLLETLWE